MSSTPSSKTLETVPLTQPYVLGYSTAASTMFGLLALALASLPIIGIIVSNNRGDGQSGTFITLGVLIFLAPVIWFGYFAVRGLTYRGKVLEISPEGLRGKLVGEKPIITWADIATVQLKTQGGYTKLTLTLHSNEQVTFMDIGTLRPSLSKAFELIKHRLETGVLAFPPKGPWWMSETALVIGGLAFVVALLAGIIAIAKSWN